MVVWDVERILQFGKDEVDGIEGNAVVISRDTAAWRVELRW